MQGKVSFDLYFWNDLHLQRVTNTATRNFLYFLTTECSLDRRKKNTCLLFNQIMTRNMSELNEVMPRDIYLNKTIEIAYMKEKILRLKTMNEMIHKRHTNVCKKKKRKLFRKLIRKIRHFVC